MDSQKPTGFGSSWAFNTPAPQQQQPAQPQAPGTGFAFGSGFGAQQPPTSTAAQPFGSNFGTTPSASTTSFGNFFSNVNPTAPTNNSQPLPSAPSTAFSFGSSFGGAPATGVQAPAVAPPAFGVSSGFPSFGSISSMPAATTTSATSNSGFGAFGSFGAVAPATSSNAGPFSGFGMTQPTVAAAVAQPPASFSFGQSVANPTSSQPNTAIFGSAPVQAPATAPVLSSSISGFFSGSGLTAPQQTFGSTTPAVVTPAVSTAGFTGFGFGQQAPAASAATSAAVQTTTPATSSGFFNFGTGSQQPPAAVPFGSASNMQFGFGTSAPMTTVSSAAPSVFGAFSAPSAAQPAPAPTTGFSFGNSGAAAGGPAAASSVSFGMPLSTSQSFSAGGTTKPQPPYQQPAASTGSSANATSEQNPHTFGTSLSSVPSLPSTTPSIFGALPQQPSVSSVPTTTAVGSGGFSFSFGGAPVAGTTANTQTGSLPTAPATAPAQVPLSAVPASPAVVQPPASNAAPTVATTAAAVVSQQPPAFSFGTTTPSVAAPSSGFSFGSVKPATPAVSTQAAFTAAVPLSSSSAFGSGAGFSFNLPSSISSGTTPQTQPQPQTTSVSNIPSTPAISTPSIAMPTAAPQTAQSSQRPTFQFGGTDLSAAPVFVPTAVSTAAPAVVSSSFTLQLPTAKPLQPAAFVSQQQPVISDRGAGLVLAPSTNMTASLLQQQQQQLLLAQPAMTKPVETVIDSGASTGVPASTSSAALVSPSRATRVQFQLPHSGLVVSPGKGQQRGGAPGTVSSAALVVDEQDRDRMLKMLRTWTWRDLSEFCDLQARELDTMYSETFHVGHIWLLSLQVLREDMQDKLALLIESTRDDYDQSQRLERELDYIDAELNELEKLIDSGEAMVHDRTSQYDANNYKSAVISQQQQQFYSPPGYSNNNNNSFYAGNNSSMPPGNQLSDYLHDLYSTVHHACASTNEFQQRFETIRSAFTSTLFPPTFSGSERHWVLEAPQEAQQSSSFSQLVLSSIAYAELFRFDRLHHMLRCLEQIQLEYEHLYKNLTERMQPEVAVRIAADIERRLRVVEAHWIAAEKDDEQKFGGNILNNQRRRLAALPAAGSGGGLDMMPMATTLLSAGLQPQ